MICALNEAFNGATCVKIAGIEDGKIQMADSIINLDVILTHFLSRRSAALLHTKRLCLPSRLPNN